MTREHCLNVFEAEMSQWKSTFYTKFNHYVNEFEKASKERASHDKIYRNLLKKLEPVDI